MNNHLAQYYDGYINGTVYTTTDGERVSILVLVKCSSDSDIIFYNCEMLFKHIQLHTKLLKLYPRIGRDERRCEITYAFDINPEFIYITPSQYKLNRLVRTV